MKTFKSLSVIGLMLGYTLVTHADVITIRADEWYPVNGKPGSEKPGFMIETATAIFAKAGHSVDYKILPWERSVNETRKGNFNCIVGAAEGDAPDFSFPSKPMGMSSTNFYALADSIWELSDISSLNNVKLGVIKGYSYGDEIDAYIEKNNKKNVIALGANNSLEQNIKKLMNKRIDVTLESPMIFNAKLKEMGLDTRKIVNKGSLDPADPLYIACNKDSQEYVDLLSAGLEEMIESGELANILEKYDVQPWW